MTPTPLNAFFPTILRVTIRRPVRRCLAQLAGYFLLQDYSNTRESIDGCLVVLVARDFKITSPHASRGPLAAHSRPKPSYSRVYDKISRQLRRLDDVTNKRFINDFCVTQFPCVLCATSSSFVISLVNYHID